MKIRRQLAALEPMILARVRGVTGDDWHRAPGKHWTIAQILHHVAVSMDGAVSLLEERKDRTDLRRRASPRQHLMRHLLLGVGRFPPGRKAPAWTIPPERPDPELAMAQYRMALERLTRLADALPLERQARLFVRHPVVGDLNFAEWVRFFYVHNRHHGHQLAVRLRWLRRQPHAPH
jgi:hypothetical protein